MLAFPQVSGMTWGPVVRGGMASLGLMTRRSQVHILPPLLRNGPSGAVSFFSGDAQVTSALSVLPSGSLTAQVGLSREEVRGGAK